MAVGTPDHNELRPHGSGTSLLNRPVYRLTRMFKALIQPLVSWVEAARWVVRSTAVGPCSVVTEVLYDELHDALGQLPHPPGRLALGLWSALSARRLQNESA